MRQLLATTATIQGLVSVLATVGGPLGWVLLAAAATLLTVSAVPALSRAREPVLWVTAGLLGLGELLLLWFHWTLYQAAVVVSPAGHVVGHVATPPWIESEKLYMWALVVTVMTLLVRKDRDEMLPILGAIMAVLVAGAVLIGQPFTAPLPQFLTQYGQYVQAMASRRPQAMAGAFQGMSSTMTYYYNAWFMWMHPPLLFLSYGALVVAFSGVVLMVWHKRGRYEQIAYDWTKIGYIALTLGMLLGFPWAIMSWQGEAWWWSGKVNMSITMWLLYTAYLHSRLYLRRRGMWRWVAALALLAFLSLVLTYITTYVVPGAHSVA
jgi:ABC-type transport system involved in cytochrome c biogenesis permease subunit